MDMYPNALRSAPATVDGIFSAQTDCTVLAVAIANRPMAADSRPECLGDGRIDFVGDNEFEILKCGDVDRHPTIQVS